jgi:molybdopterin-guanine dinucleotide biosynthesis protein A
MWHEGRKSLQRQFPHWPIYAPKVPDMFAGQLVNVNTPEELSQVQPQPSSTP